MNWFDYFVMANSLWDLLSLLLADIGAIVVVLYLKKHGGIFY